MKDFNIHTEYITLGQFLKAEAFVGSGGEAKFFLWENDVYLNGEKKTERGKKIYNGDVIKIDKQVYRIVYDSKN